MTRASTTVAIAGRAARASHGGGGRHHRPGGRGRSPLASSRSHASQSGAPRPGRRRGFATRAALRSARRAALSARASNARTAAATRPVEGARTSVARGVRRPMRGATARRDFATVHPVGTLEDELALTARVGKELARLNLRQHVAKLRLHYAALRAGRPSPVWSHELSIEWLRMLRLHPHENDYVVLPRMSSCPGCPVSTKYTSGIFPGGSKHTCGACKTTWLELDAITT